MKQYLPLAVPLLIVGACSAGDRASPTGPEFKSAAARSSASSITVTSLPSLGGASTARAINDNQVIVGSSNGLPVKWTLVSGGWHVQPLQSSGGVAEDITESGIIVGSSGGSVALLSAENPPEIIGAGVPAAMNESQVVVGLDRSAAGTNPARAWTRSGTGWLAHALLGTADFPSGYCEPTDINENEVIVGFAVDVSGSSRAVKWIPNGVGGWDGAVFLDNVAATNYGSANAILGQDIVGNILRCWTCRPLRDPYHWSLTAGQGIGSLGTADAWAEGLNKERSIVGSFFFGGVHAFVRTLAIPTIRDLGAPNGYLSASAYDINSPTDTRSATQVVGEASARNGRRTAVLWTLP